MIARCAQRRCFLRMPLLLKSETPRRDPGCQHLAGLSLPRPRRLPHPGVYAEALAPAQAESAPLAPAPSGAPAHSAPRRCGQRQGLAPLGAAHPAVELARSFPCRHWTRANTRQRAAVQMERMEVPSFMCSCLLVASGAHRSCFSLGDFNVHKTC